jgi:hypothetical protein
LSPPLTLFTPPDDAVCSKASICKQMQTSINIRHVSLSGCQREAMKGDTKLGRRLKAAIEAKTKEDTAAREKQHKTDARLCNDAGINADVVAWYLGDQVGDEILCLQ